MESMELVEFVPKDGVTEVLNALLKAKKEFGPLLRSKKGNFGKYVPLETVLEAIEPALEKQGLLIIQGVHDGNLVTEVWHAQSGQSIIRSIPLMLEKNTPQGVGSALTYARRYSLLTTLNLAQEDDDGQRAEDEHRPSQKPPVAMGQNRAKAAVDPKAQSMLGAPDYVITLGKKLKGLKLSQVDPDQLEGFVRWLQGEAEKKKEPLQGAALDFIQNASAYLKNLNADVEGLCQRCGAPYEQCTCGT